MRRLWHRLNTVPSQTHCIYCTNLSRSSLILPSLLSKTSNSSPPLFPFGLFRSYQTSSDDANQYNKSREESAGNVFAVESDIQHLNKPALLADFYRSLSTQDIDRIWPLYTYLYNNDLLSYITRKNYHNLFIYTIRSRATQRNLQRLTALTDDMRQRGYHLRLGEYNALIHWVGGKSVPNKRPHHLTDAMQIFDDMQKSEVVIGDQVVPQIPVQPSVVTYNTLIQIAAHLLDLRTAQSLYQDMLSRGIHPDEYTYSTLLHSMGKSGDVNGIDRMLRDIQNKGLVDIANNIVIWNIVMSGYACNGFKERAYAIFDQMVQKHAVNLQRKKKKKNAASGQIPAIDAESYRIRIDLTIHDNRREEAINLLYNMHSLHIKPTVTIYNTLFASFMEPKKHHHLYDIGNIENIDIDDNSNKKLLETVHELYEHMKKSKVKPNSETMYTLVSAFLDLGDTKSALETFVDLSSIEQQPAGNNIQSTAVSTLTKERRLIVNKDPTKLEPSAELLSRINSVVTKSVN